MTDLRELIGLRKGDRSYEQLSRDCGGKPTSKRLHQLATEDIKNFPDPTSIRSLAKGLGVTESTVVLAAAASLGLDVHTPTMWAALLPSGTELIPEHMRDGILSVVQSAVRMAKNGAEADDDQAVAEQSSNVRVLPRRVRTAARQRSTPKGDDNG